MRYKTALFSHLKVIRQCLAAIDADATIEFETMALEIKARNRCYMFYPQFVQLVDGYMSCTPYLTPDATGFMGWLPYFNKHWPIARDKLAFKQFCADQGLKTPAWVEHTSGMHKTFILKPRAGSFARGIEGPYRSAADLPKRKPETLAGFFCEQFVPGRVAKIWYWEQLPVAAELVDMPAVTGDGQATLRQLVAARVALPERSKSGLSLADVVSMAKVQGVTLDSTIPAGKSVTVDFRFGSPFHPVSFENRDALGRLAGTPLLKRFQEAGVVFQSGLPEALRKMTLYAVDAIVDANDLPWYLEMNCNPVVYPQAYGWILGSLFGPATPPEKRRAPKALPGLPPPPPRGTPLGAPAAASSHKRKTAEP